MSKEFVAVDVVAQVIREVDGNHALGAGVLAERILAHPDFQRQVRAYAAEVARGCLVAERDPSLYPLAVAHNHGFNEARAETLAAIDRWERSE